MTKVLREIDVPIAVGMVDNDVLTLGALRALLTRMDGIRVAWVTGNGGDAIDLCRDPHSRPDVLLVDMSMEPMLGADVCARIRGAGLRVGLVCITSFALRTYAAGAAGAGAQAIVSKTDLPGIRDAIRSAARGQASPSPVPGVTFHDVGATIDAPDVAHADHANQTGACPTGTLSARELQIIRMLADGVETEGISRALSLSRYTVATYIRRACDKLGARNRTHLIALCERRGLL